MRFRNSLPAILVAAVVAACAETPTAPANRLSPTGGTSAFSGNVSPGLHIAVTAVDFGTVRLGTTSSQETVAVTNLDAVPVTLSGSVGVAAGPFTAGQNCQGTTLDPGQSCQMSFGFAPTAAGAATATATGTWNGQAFGITLSGTGSTAPPFRIEATALDFGQVPAGATSLAQIVTVTNLGAAPVVMAGAGGAPGNPFAVVQNCQGLTLGPGQSCQMTYTFTPSAAGPATATASGSWNGQAYSIALSGFGSTPPLFRVTPTAFDFSDIAVGSISAPDTVTVTNISPAPITMSGAGGNPTGEFTAGQTCQGVTLAPGGKCYAIYYFRPTAAGAATSTSAGTWNGQPFNITLKGNGLGPRFRISPTTFEFSEIPVGSISPPETVTVTNIGTAPITMSGAGGNPTGEFTAGQTCQGLTLPPGGQCYAIYYFRPTTTGAATSSSSGTWNGVPFNITLNGTGIPTGSTPTALFQVTPTAFDFSDIAVGSISAPDTVTVTNISPAPITMSGAGGNPTGEFTAGQTCQGLTLPPGGKCYAIYYFRPTTAGAATSTSSGTWNGQPFNITLKGNGIGPRFRISPTTFEFSEIPVGSISPPETVTVTNIGTTPVTMSGAGGNPTGEFTAGQTCQGLTLPPGGQCYAIYYFRPTTTGAATSSSSGTWNGVPFNITLNGTGVAPAFRISPTGLDFGEVPVGGISAPDTVTVTNISTGSISMAGAGGNPTGEFTGGQNCLGLTVPPQASCYLIYDFRPTAAGPATSASIGSWNGQAYDIALKGVGGTAPGLRITPVGFDFGVVPVGTTSPPLTTVVTNVGSTPVVMSGTGGTASGDFSVTENCEGTTLAPGQSCAMSFSFSPTTIGAATTTVNGTWNGQAYSIALQGNGGFTVSGFFSPLGQYPEFQLVRAGAVIPLNFSLGGDQGLGILASGFPASGPVACGSGPATTVEETGTAGQSGLQYDQDTETYTYLWKSDRAWGGSCRSLVMKLVDGSVLRANFQFK